MKHTIQQITEHFASRLPEAPEHYSIKDMEAQDFPDFLIRRIHIELQEQLDQSIAVPQTDWVHIQSQAVQEAWRQFLNTMHTKVCLPADHAHTVIETAVTDIVKMLIQPRKHIPVILYGSRNRLSASELSERTALLVVYPHFARVLNAYMEQKGRNDLSRRRCKEIIKQVDEKVTSQYEPLQWVQMLDPLFTLTHASVDADLLCLFFEEREMPDTARKFGRIDSKITQAEFIEVFSSSEDDEQPILFSDDMIADKAKKGDDGHKNGRRQATDDRQQTADDKSETADADEKPEAKSQHPTSDIPHSTSHIKRQASDETASLNDIFTNDEETEEKDKKISDTPSQSEQDEESELQNQDEEEEESPMWKHYMDPEDEETRWEDVENRNREQINSEYTRQSAVALAGEENNKKREQELEELLADEESYFVKKLFNGSAEAYRKSLREIGGKDSWREASTLISRNIFKRNMINIYSEAAVDFTDRLQTYFLEKQDQNN